MNYSSGKIIKQLNITRTTLYRLFERHNITPIRTDGGHYRITDEEFIRLKTYVNTKSKKKLLILLKNNIKKRVKDIYTEQDRYKVVNEINAILDKHFNRLNIEVRLNEEFRL
jgi:excisionase family DNA binding protein